MEYLNSIKRLILFFLVVFFAIGIVSKVTSFSSATIESPAILTITENGDALISTQQFSWRVMQGLTTTESIRIVNNLAKDIAYLEVWFENVTGVTIDDIEGERVRSGQSALLDVNISAAEDVEPQTVEIGMFIYAKWDGGEAKIETTGELKIEENPDLLVVEGEQLLQSGSNDFTDQEKIAENLNSQESIPDSNSDDLNNRDIETKNEQNTDEIIDEEKIETELGQQDVTLSEVTEISGSEEGKTGGQVTERLEDETQEKINGETQAKQTEEDAKADEGKTENTETD